MILACCMFADVCRKNLQAIVAAYRQATGLSVSVVSARFYGNAGFLPAFFAGTKTVSLDKFDDMIGHLRTEWPKNADWPVTRAAILPRPRKKIVHRKN